MRHSLTLVVVILSLSLYSVNGFFFGAAGGGGACGCAPRPACPPPPPSGCSGSGVRAVARGAKTMVMYSSNLFFFLNPHFWYSDIWSANLFTYSSILCTTTTGIFCSRWTWLGMWIKTSLDAYFTLSERIQSFLSLPSTLLCNSLVNWTCFTRNRPSFYRELLHLECRFSHNHSTRFSTFCITWEKVTTIQHSSWSSQTEVRTPTTSRKRMTRISLYPTWQAMEACIGRKIFEEHL